MRPGFRFLTSKLARCPNQGRPLPDGVDLKTSLNDLPAWSVDTETTGLHVVADAIVSIGAVRIKGGQALLESTVYSLVKAPVSITATAHAIHGLKDEDLAAAPTLAALWGRLGGTLMDSVWIGHNIAFDIAQIHYDLGRTRIRWQGPIALDVMLLSAALDPRGSHDLDALAQSFGLAIDQRHHALGDALATAELYFKILPLLANKGIDSLGDALRFQRRATAYLYGQSVAGWHTP
jgi:DNA polymerase-3 subunit epsilon